MTTTQLSIFPLTITNDIPPGHLYAFKVCNSAGAWWCQRAFYALKNQLLEKYGHPADYDLQIIKKQCYACGGTGRFRDMRCNRCDNGIYQIRKVVLKRFILNNQLFHKPVGNLMETTPAKIAVIEHKYDEFECDYYPTYKYLPLDGPIINTIGGLIKHTPYGLNATWAYYYLLWHYNRESFHHRINYDIKIYRTNTQHKLKRLLNIFNPLKAYAEFFKIKETATGRDRRFAFLIVQARLARVF